MNIITKLRSRFKTELGGQIISMLSGAVLIIALARLLSSNEYGTLFLTISVFSVAKLFSKLGISSSVARYVTKYKEKDPSQIKNILTTGFVFNILTIVVVCSIFLLFNSQIANLIGEPEISSFLIFGVFYIAFSTLLRFARITLQGFEAIKQSAIIHAINKLSRLFFAIGLVSLGYGALGALIGYIIAFAISSCIGLGYIFFRFYKDQPEAPLESGLRRRIVEYTIPLTATSTANVLDRRVDTILVGFFIGPTAVAYYTISKQIVDFIEGPASALGFTITPTLASQSEKGDPETAARIYEKSLSTGLLFYIPAAAGLALVSEPLISIVFGNGYLGAIPLVQLFSVYVVMMSINRLTSQGLNYLGRARERAIAKGISSVLNVLLNIILIPAIGVVGAVISTILTYSLYTILNVVIMAMELNLRFIWLMERILKILIVTSIMSITVIVSLDFINGIFSLIFVISIGVVIWLISSLLIGLIKAEKLKIF